MKTDKSMGEYEEEYGYDYQRPLLHDPPSDEPDEDDDDDEGDDWEEGDDEV